MIIDATCSVVERKMKEEKSKPNLAPGGPGSILFVKGETMIWDNLAFNGGSFTCSVNWNESYSDISISEYMDGAETPTTWTLLNNKRDNSVVYNFFD